MTALHQFDGESEDEFRERWATWHSRRLEASGLPVGLRTGPVIDSVPDAARRWAEVKVGGLVLTGPVGVGKTTLAAEAFVRRMWSFTGRGAWRSLPTLMAHLNAGFGTEQQEEAIKVIDGRYLLALDDLDKSRPNELAAERVFAAIDNTITNQLPLIVTTNASLPELAAHWARPWGKPIVSRLKGYCEVVEMKGRDRRLDGPQSNEGDVG